MDDKNKKEEVISDVSIEDSNKNKETENLQKQIEELKQHIEALKKDNNTLFEKLNVSLTKIVDNTAKEEKTEKKYSF